MVVFALDKVRKLPYLQNNIRNISVIAHIDHGKSTLTDSLVAAAGVTSVELASDERLACQDESDRSSTSKSAIHTLGYEMPGSDFEGNRDGNRYLITLIDSPGHVDFSPEATTALRITDGALVVVDWLEGVSLQTEALLRQALGERIKHVLAVNKLDRCFMEFMLDGEDAYIGFLHAIENANAVVATYTDGALGECQVDPSKGTVAFSSGLHGWAFTLTTFARMYASKFGTDEAKMMERLWGDNFFDPATEKWTKNRTESKTCQRGFVRLIYEPIRVLIKACMDDDREKVFSMTDNLGIRHLLKPGDWKLVGKPLMKRVMQTWLPAQNVLLEMMIAHLPSPATAQKYRVDNLYEGPLDDPYAVAMRECDPWGPLMVYISNIIPASEKGQFYALGRVFSGRISTGQKVRIMGPSYKPGTGIGLYIRNVQGTVLCMGTHQQTVETAPCGNIVALAGLDQCITKNATLSNERNEDAHLIKDVKLSQPCILRVAVEPKVADDLPKLVEGLKMLSKFNPGVQCSVEATGEHIIAGTGELHLGMCIKDLKETFMIGANIQVSDTIVSSKEIITSESDHTCMTKTANRFNRIFMKARPMEEGLAEGIENGKIGPTDDVHARSRILTEQFGWDEEKTRKIWAFSPDTTGPNLLLDVTKGVKLVDELMRACIPALQWCSKEGVLAEENLRGCIFEVIDAHLHLWPSKWGMGQLIPASRRAMFASTLTAMPRLMEPIYLVQIQAQENALKDIHSVLSQKRGRVFEQFQRPGTHTYSIKAFVPTWEAFGLASTLRAKGAQSIPQSVFDHWEIFPHDPLISGSPAALLVESIRKRKGLTPRQELGWICPCFGKP